jgi:protein O-mannosyl-transferase
MPEQDFSFKNLFVPLTTFKAIHWIVIVGLIVYGNMLFNGFVLDDLQYVIPNSIINGQDIIKHFSANIFNSYGYYRPIPAVYFSYIYGLFGHLPFFYHLPQLIFHIINAILFFTFLKTFFNNKLSFLLALIFLIHPLQVESVSYISQSGSVIFFFFGISALLLSRKEFKTKKYLFFIFFLLLLSILTKEAGIIFLILFILMNLLFKKRHILIDILLSTTVLATYAIIRFYLAHIYLTKMIFVPISKLSFSERLINIPAIIFYYLRTYIFPFDLATNQYWVITNMTFTSFYFPLFILFLFFTLIIFFGINIYHDKKIFSVYILFISWFIWGIIPYLQIFPIDMTVADRWFYFPLCGLLGILGILLQNIFFRYKKLEKPLTVVIVIIAILLSIRTIMRNTDWQTPLKLYTHDAKITNSYNLEAHLGNELSTSGRLDEALDHYKKSVALLESESIFGRIGYIYERKGNIKFAKEYYSKAMNAESAIPPYKHTESTYVHFARFFLYSEKNPSFAQKYINQGLREYPNSTTLWVILALDEYKMGHQSEALNAINKAYILTPSNNIKYVYMQIKNNAPLEIPIETFY